MAKIESTLTRWQRDPESFIAEMLRDPETGAPYKLLQAEKQFLSHCFKRDENGRLQFVEWLYSCPKKSGKTAWAAMLTLTAVLVYGGRFAEGYVVANDLEQSIGRVFTAIKRIVEASPDLRAEAKITQSRIEFPAFDAFIQALGNDYAGAAGGHPTITVFDELWAFASERSRRLFDELIPIPTRKISARLTVTYAGFAGESTLLEGLHKRGHEQPVIGPDLHGGDGILAFWSHKPIAPWQTPEWIEQMRGQLRPNAFRRMILNEFTAGEESFIDIAEWDSCATVLPIAADPDLPVWIGVDASVKRDSTALVAVTCDKSKRARLVTHKIFQPSSDQPLDFEGTIEATILEWRNRFKIRQVLYDPFQMAATAQRLERAGLNMVEYPQTLPNLTAMADNLFELVRARQLAVYEDAAIRLAVQRAVVSEGARGWRIAKEKQSHKIDVVIAMAMAALAAVRSWQSYPLRTSAGADRSRFAKLDERSGMYVSQEVRQHFRIRRITEQEDLRERGLIP